MRHLIFLETKLGKTKGNRKANCSFGDVWIHGLQGLFYNATAKTCTSCNTYKCTSCCALRLITKGTHTSDRWKRNEKPRPKWSGPTRRSGRIRTGHLQRTLFCWRKTLVGWRPLLLVTRNYLLVFFCASRPLLSNCCSDDAMVLCRSATAGGSFRTFGCRMAVVAELCNIFCNNVRG